MARFRCDQLFTGRRWLDDAVLEVDGGGRIVAVLEGSVAGPADGPIDGRLRGPVVPGVPNLHSHAHQRAMAGLAERSGNAGRGSFWTWREEMYRLLATLGPDELEAIAAQLYLEMLEAGYTTVGEFQYLHHGPAGEPYAQPAEMTLRCLRAAREVGIGFTALPVFYAHGGFGGRPAEEGQRRFVCDLELYGRLLEDLDSNLRDGGPTHERLGIAPHSLRATTADELRALVELAGDAMPVHIHVAEQVKEVEDSVAWSGWRPVEWLLDQAPVDGRWCLIHATHLDDGEVERLAGTGAVAGLCPITEANLGDGTFRAADFLAAGGRIGLGSDSHIRIDPAEEMRWLEYGQRLRQLERNVLAGGPERSTGRRIFEQVLEGGARACGFSNADSSPAFGLEPGARADFLLLDPDSPQLTCREGDELLDSWIFAGSRSPVRDVYVGGRRVVESGRHPRRETIFRRFRDTLDRVRARA